MIWAYMGPARASELPDWEAFGWANGFVQVVISEVPCNWLQAQENSIEPVHFEWRVPIDDEKMLSIGWMFSRVPTEREPFVHARIPTWRAPVADPATGRWYSRHVMNQDFVAWVGQGTIADRTKEKLGLSGRGIQLLRRRLLDDIKAVEQGKHPKGIIRDPASAKNIVLPAAERDFLINGATLEEIFRHPFFGHPIEEFMFQAGQPDWVWVEFCEAMGFDPEQPIGLLPATVRFGVSVEPSEAENVEISQN